MPEAPLYRRVDDDDDSTDDDGGGIGGGRTRRGRHLVAARDLAKGRLILCERPLLAAADLFGSVPLSYCHNCLAFAGGPDEAMALLSSSSATLAVDDGEEPASSSSSSPSTANADAVPCRMECGRRYCCDECETDAWESGCHACLCTGRCESDAHPLVKFKAWAAETNEMLLLAAEWWVVEHLNEDDEDNYRYSDFVMEPWWEVETIDLRQSIGGFAEAHALEKTLRDVCEEAAVRLNEVFKDYNNSIENSACGVGLGREERELQRNRRMIPPVSALDVGRRMGAFAQNAMGIRQRNPLCRAALSDPEFRSRWHGEIVNALERAGFVGDGGGDDGDSVDDKGTDAKEGVDTHDESAADLPPDNVVAPVLRGDGAPTTANGEADKSTKEVEEESGYTVDEIASFLASLYIEEEGTVRDIAEEKSVAEDDAPGADQLQQQEGDDLDYVFPPLGGTAMYSTICKMNHSCDPNVVVLYKPVGWGRRYPLTAFAVSLRDIPAGDELTICYIDKDKPYDERQRALANYGFSCRCCRCEAEKGQNPGSFAGTDLKIEQAVQANDEFELFGDDDDEDDGGGSGYVEGEETEESIDRAAVRDDEEERNDTSNEDGTAALERVVNRLDTRSNHSMFGSIPMEIVGPAFGFIIQMSSSLLASCGDTPPLSNDVVLHLLAQCKVAAEEKDFCLCKIVGCDLEGYLYGMLKQNRSWPHTAYRESYWCAVLASSIGCCHKCHFLQSLALLDKGIMLGLPLDKRLGCFVAYVESHASEMAQGPYKPAATTFCQIDDFRQPHLRAMALKKGLGRPIEFDVAVEDRDLQYEEFRDNFYATAQPVVFREYASDWKSVDSWRNLRELVYRHGHRLCPIEVGSMLAGTLKEEVISFREFVASWLLPSSGDLVWTLEDATNPTSKVAYLAQHPLLSQISALRHDVELRPRLCGPDPPSNINVWIGTGGTRTPLHFDSYDNLFIQVVGVKYIRLYAQEESSKLHINGSNYGLQGNMSDVNCEREDDRHPMAKSAKYSEVILFPGDSLFIPSRKWHYVRSLTTSMSVNYWF